MSLRKSPASLGPCNGQDPKILSSIMDLYKLYYELAKDNFISEDQVDKETEDFLASL
jgi:hypothetical protein